MKYCLLSILLLLSFPNDTLAQRKYHSVADSVFYYLKDIVIKGKTKTKKTIILRELSLQKGDKIQGSKLAELNRINTQRLKTISIFNEVSIRWTSPINDSIMMVIRLKDRFPVFPEVNLEFADRNFNVWWQEQHHDFSRINFGMTLTNNNFRGRREGLSLSGQIGYTQKIGISYSRPYIDKNQKHGLGISFFGLQNKEVAYNTIDNKLVFYRNKDHYMLRRSDIGIWYTYRPKYASTHTLKLTWQHYWISQKIAQLNAEFLGNSQTEGDNFWLQYRFEWNRVDNWNYPLTGQRFIGILNERYLTTNHQFQTSLHLQYDQYLNPLPKWYLAFIFRGRLSQPTKQPYIFRRNLGYEFDYVRGFEYYVIDGSAFALLRIDLKYCLLDYELKLPVRYLERVPIRIYAKLFGDAGMSYDKFPKNDFLNNRMLYSGGIGLDIVTLYDVKLRIEYTFNSLNEKGLFLHKSGE